MKSLGMLCRAPYRQNLLGTSMMKDISPQLHLLSLLDNSTLLLLRSQEHLQNLQCKIDPPGIARLALTMLMEDNNNQAQLRMEACHSYLQGRQILEGTLYRWPSMIPLQTEQIRIST